jgi:type IV pilus assembly protein PilM
VELLPEGVLAGARSTTGQQPVYAFQPLPAGTLALSITEPNLPKPETVTAAIRKALDQVSPRSRDVTLVLPDTLFRIFMLDFDSMPSKAEEAYSVLRFRLRKMVSFDVEHAGLSYQILTKDEMQCKVLTAVIPGPVLAEYEAAVRAAGYEPGAVLPSGLVALEVIDSMESVLAACLSSVALTTTITNGNDLLLYRTLDLPEDPEQRVGEVQQGIAVAAAYFEDKLQVKPSRVLYAGNHEPSEFAQWIDNPELAVGELCPHPETGATTALGNISIAGVAGALTGVR